MRRNFPGKLPYKDTSKGSKFQENHSDMGYLAQKRKISRDDNTLQLSFTICQVRR